jgi:predicted dehydrogenase
MSPVRVVLAGARGHGLWHLANLQRLTKAGLVDLVGVCDVDRVDLTEFGGLGDPVQSDDLGGLIERTGAEITILVTPIHTHAALAVTAMHAGSHLLLEKPPAGSLADFEWISRTARDTGRACQVGFQALGSEAIPFLRKVIAGGQLGRMTGVGVAGAWDRPAAYFTRSPWSGRRRLGGVAVTDGALTNPFAHAVAAALAVAEAEQLGAVTEIDVELYRANPIEADDTSCVRLRLPDGTALTIAVTLCAPGRNEPYLVVHGETGQATLDYTLDQVTLRPDGGAPATTTHPRTDLLENLIAHVRTGTQLLVPLSRTGSFMQVVEAVRLAPDPLPISADHQEVHRSAGAVTRRVVPGVVDATVRSAERLALYSELDLPWAPQEQVVHLAGRDVARYRWLVDLPAGVSPRPHLHPVCTLGGIELSELAPGDHAHHLGVGVAIADVGGSNFWGGRTFVPGKGPTWLHDHGSQRHLRFGRRATDGFVEHLEWLDADGVPVLGEEREISARPLDGSCWALDFSFTLTNLAANPPAIRSSATKGREGAGYGGFFWRAPGSAVHRTVFTADADGEEAINGTRAPWVAMSGTTPDGRDWTLVFAQLGSNDPWFVRVREYPGIGPALAGERPLVLDGSLTRRVITIIADGRLDREISAELVGTLQKGGRSWQSGA